MSQAPVMPMYVDAMVADTMHLSAEAFGAYHLLLYATWRNNGRPLPDDDAKLARICRTSTAKWRRALRADLVGFFDITDGTWRQKRLENEWNSVANRIETARINGSAGGRAKALNSNKSTLANANDPVERNSSENVAIHIHEPLSSSEEGGLKTSVDPLGPSEVREAVSAWNAMAESAGLPTVQVISKARASKIRARLRDAGGIGGWHEAMRRIAATPWMLGDNNRGWRADIDYIVQESKFIKLMEAGDPKAALKGQPANVQPARPSRYDTDLLREGGAAFVAGHMGSRPGPAGYS